MPKKRSLSSNRWLYEHFKDPYVKKTHNENIRSRAWFKLDNIQKHNKILKKGMTVVDLGSSPGSWSEYASKKVGSLGSVIACDILPMKPIRDVFFIQGDIKEKLCFNSLLSHINFKQVNLIMSDMAPNMTGHCTIDHINSIYLSKLALNISLKILLKDGCLLLKSFHGEEFCSLINRIKNVFFRVKICKPHASRARSREVYILASGKKF